LITVNWSNIIDAVGDLASLAAALITITTILCDRSASRRAGRDTWTKYGKDRGP
jgi:hypothetical protein